MRTDAAVYQQECARREIEAARHAERELLAAMERTEDTLRRLRAELNAKRAAREAARQRIEHLNRRDREE